MKLLLITLLLLPQVLLAQSNRVTQTFSGISFTIPQGWEGQESDVGYVIYKQSYVGGVIITPNGYSKSEMMKTLAYEGLVDDGINMKMASSFQSIGNQADAATFEGYIGEQNGNAYVVTMEHPYANNILMLGFTISQNFDESFVQMVKSVALGMKFFNPKKSSRVSQWKSKFQNARLTYIDSYYSTDGVGGGAGYSDKVIIDLCASGYFTIDGHSSFSAGDGASGGYGGDNQSGQGRWDIIQGPTGQGFLQLQYQNGQTETYELSSDQEGKTYLEGARYFVTYGADGPNCG